MFCSRNHKKKFKFWGTEHVEIKNDVHLRNGSPLVNGDKYFVQKRLEVVASDTIHYKAF